MKTARNTKRCPTSGLAAGKGNDVDGRMTERCNWLFKRAREVICATNDFVQLAPSLALLINEQLRITDKVDKQNVPDFQSQLRFSSSGMSITC